MHSDLWNAILAGLIALATGLIRAAIVTPRSHDVALKIRTLADDAAAVILTAAPNAPWADKLQAVISKLDSMIPGIDGGVLESAATGALSRLGAAQSALTTGTSSIATP